MMFWMTKYILLDKNDFFAATLTLGLHKTKSVLYVHDNPIHVMGSTS